jgi:parvulin-like peptidyl-prolyl isomerase
VKNYFTANKEKYSQGAGTLVTYTKSSDEESAKKVYKEYLLGKIAKGKDPKEQNEQLVSSSNPFLSPDLTNKILAADVNKTIGPEQIEAAWYVIKIRKKETGKPVVYEQIEKQVQIDYRRTKEQELYQKLFDETLKASDVKIYLERVK